MRSIQTSTTFPLSSVKPLDGLTGYRARCLEATHAALAAGSVRRRDRSPVSGEPLEPFGEVEGCAYARCAQSGSLFLAQWPRPEVWAALLAEISRYRHSPDAFHSDLVQSRVDHVYAPRLEWVQETLRLQHVERPTVLEVTTPPSDLTRLLAEHRAVVRVLTVDEMQLAHPALGRQSVADAERVDVAVMFESLDRVDDPVALLRAVAERLTPGGLLFVTALVSSGFDLAVLGLRNLYLYPPDRANCFSLRGLTRVVEAAGFSLLEASTPGVLDVEIVRAHLERDPSLSVSGFERQLIEAGRETQEAMQTFLQTQGLSSFARLVARKES